MANIINRRNTTNKNFKDTFVELASNEVKKGHLTNQSRKAEDVQVIEGVLKYIIIDQIDINGWIVEVGDAPNTYQYECYNAQGGMWIPDSIITDNRYVPKQKTKVEISIDKFSKIYKVTKIITDNKIPLASFGNTLYISTNTNTKTNQGASAAIEMGKDVISMITQSLIIQNGETEIDLIDSHNEIQALKEENDSLKKRIENIENNIKEKED